MGSRLPRFASKTIRAAGSVILVAALLGAALTPGVFSVTPPAAAAAQADPKGCGYGTGGPDAATICWFDFAGYDQATASSSAGQNRAVTLPRLHHDVQPARHPQRLEQHRCSRRPGVRTVTDRQLGLRRDPWNSRASCSQAGAATTFVLRNIVVKDSAGATVNGLSLVSADAEATAAGEQINWKSNVPITTRALMRPAAGANPENGCQMSITGSGTNSLTCTGSGTGASRYGSVLVQAASGAPGVRCLAIANRFRAEGGGSLAVRRAGRRSSRERLGAGEVSPAPRPAATRSVRSGASRLFRVPCCRTGSVGRQRSHCPRGGRQDPTRSSSGMRQLA